MTSERKKPAILIVDDDRNTREGLQRALKFRYDVRLAADAQMAMDEMAYGDVEVMLTDVRMPGMNGLDLLKTVRAKYPKTSASLRARMEKQLGPHILDHAEKLGYGTKSYKLVSLDGNEPPSTKRVD